MELKELRIGNMLASGDGIVFAVPVKTIDDIKNKVNFLDIKLFKPIELTEDWLLKFGGVWRKEHSDYIFETEEAMYSVAMFSSGINSFYIEMSEDESIELTELKHVHTLQNLYFALTGLELTIKE